MMEGCEPGFDIDNTPVYEEFLSIANTPYTPLPLNWSSTHALLDATTRNVNDTPVRVFVHQIIGHHMLSYRGIAAVI